jgi:DNA-directed RNA polymerase beta' subunit
MINKDLRRWNDHEDQLLKRIKSRSARLARLIEIDSPKIIIEHEWEMLCRSWYQLKDLQSRKAWIEAAEAGDDPEGDGQ